MWFWRRWVLVWITQEQSGHQELLQALSQMKYTIFKDPLPNLRNTAQMEKKHMLNILGVDCI